MDSLELRTQGRRWNLTPDQAWSVVADGPTTVTVVAGSRGDCLAQIRHLAGWTLVPVGGPLRVAQEGGGQILEHKPVQVHAGRRFFVTTASGAVECNVRPAQPPNPKAPVPQPPAPHAAPAPSIPPTTTTPGRGRRQWPLTASPLTIGRSANTADIVLDGLDVELRHATVRASASGVLIDDRSRSSGIAVNGTPVGSALLRTGESASLGHWVITAIPGGILTAQVRLPAVLEFDQVSARYRHAARNTLESVSFRLDNGGVLAVIGPSGGGKSTLCKVVVGDVEVVAGAVYLAEQGGDTPIKPDLVSYVPQAESLILDLTVRDALRYVARLRLARTTTGAERTPRVDAVLAELELSAQADQMVGALSGGQKKRVSIAMELLSSPVLLVLDEPTSGLDEGLDRSLMSTLRRLSTDVACLVVTHSMVNLELATKVVAINARGAVAYEGDPAGVLPAFGATTYADVMNDLRSAATPHDHVQPAGAPGPRLRVGGARVRAGTTLLARELRRWWPRRATYGSGGVAGLLRDRRVLHLLLAPLAVVGVASVTGSRGLAGTPTDPSSRLGATIMVLNFTSAFFATALTVPTIVGDLDVVRRERRWGVSVPAAVVSRALFFAPIAIVQAVVSLALFLALRPGPNSALDVPAAALFLAALALTNVASACLGLLISAVSPSAEKAVFGLMGAAVAQVVLTGLVIPFGALQSFADHLMLWLSYAVPTRWGAAAMAASTDLRHSGPAAQDALWNADIMHAVAPLIALAALSFVYVAIAARQLSVRLGALD